MIESTTELGDNTPVSLAPLSLTSFEARVIGVLIEKRFVTPDAYPLSLNSLALGCNQLTGREPVMALSDIAVTDTLALLTDRKLAAARQQAGARVVKYEHRLMQHFALDDETLALLAVLLLRGAQTAGELKQRTERMVGFADIAAVDAALQRMATMTPPLAQALPKAPGTKEHRYIETLTDPAERGYSSSDTAAAEHSSDGVTPVGKGRLGELEDEVARLQRDLTSLTHAFLDFKARLE